MRHKAVAVWLTGLPCSGKSTLATSLRLCLHDLGIAVQVLDGDEVRQSLSKGLGFSKADRAEHLRRLTLLTRWLVGCGVLTITATISPYRCVRESARRTLERFVEVYVKCPLEVCMQRDVKGLYRRALAGEISHFTGVSDPFEEPDAPEIIVETHKESVAECVGRIVTYLGVCGGLAQPVAPPALRPAEAGFLQRVLDQGWSWDAEQCLTAQERTDSVRAV